MDLKPVDLQEQWGQPLRRVKFDPTPVLADDANAFFSVAGLPESVTVGCSRFRFVTVSRRLVDVWQQEIDPRMPMPPDWNRFWHLGDVEYDQSQAWICIEEKTGQIILIDVEIDDPLTLINTSILLFMTSLLVLRDWHRETGGSMDELEGLIEALQSEVKQNDAEKYWIPFLEYEQESEEESLDVSVS